MPKVIEKLKASYFYKTIHRIIFLAILKLFENDITIDALSVMTRLREDGNLDKIGGPIAISEILESTPTSVGVENYIEIVKSKAILRELINRSTRIIEDAYTGDANEVLSNAEKMIFELNTNGDSEIKHIDDFTEYIIENYIVFSETQFRTGISKKIDEKIRLQKGLPFFVAGLPGGGKTSFILNMLINIAKDGTPVGFFSQEMSGHMVNFRAGFTAGPLTEQGFLRYKNGIKRIANLPIYIDETTGLTPYQLRTKTMQMVRKYGIQLIALDYIQLAEGRGQTIIERESDISKTIKNIAKETNTCWIVISQMTKDAYRRKSRNMADIKGSGQLVQDARGIYFLEQNDENQNQIDFWCAKQNNGAANWMVSLYFDKDNNRFTELEPGEKEDDWWDK